MKMFAMAMAVGCLAVSAVGGEPYGLMVERQENPCGVDATAPRFSWKMSVEKGAKNVAQSAYRVLVASSQEKLARDDGERARFPIFYSRRRGCFEVNSMAAPVRG